MTDPFAIRGPAVLNVSGGRTSALMLRRVLDARGENARCRSAALATARREGAEEMRAALVERFKGRMAYLRSWADVEAVPDDEIGDGEMTGAWNEAGMALMITRDMVLPLDAPGGAT